MTAIRNIEEDNEKEKTNAMLRLMCELNKGRRSGDEKGYISAANVRTHFQNRQK